MSEWLTIKNLKSSDASVSATPPWATSSPSSPDPQWQKEKFREWCADSSTDHVFYSANVGINPGLRVSAENPVAKTWALVADYDSDLLVAMSDAEIDAKIDAAVAKKGILPGWASRTFSNKVRLVWEFEKPVHGSPEPLWKAAMEGVVGVTGARRMLPGFDETSISAIQVFELGGSWRNLGGKVVDSATLSGVFYNAAKKAALRADSTVEIPIEDVAAEVERRWPGQWPGDFRFGTRGPLFWLNDGVTRIGCQVGDHGMICFSDRAGKGFVPWKEVLGAKFVSDFENRKIESALDGIYYDGSRYWMKVGNGRWASHTKEDTLLKLRSMGFSGDRKKGETVSELERLLLTIHEQNRVDSVAPFLFDKRDVVEYMGDTYLNRSCRRPAQRAGGDGHPSKWPWLHRYLTGMLDRPVGSATDPNDHLKAWVKRFWESADRGDPMAGHLLVIAGEANTGKSLFGMFILREIMGGGMDAGHYLLTGGGFNKRLGEVAVWNVDDGVSASDFKDHRKFSEMLKKSAANPEINYQPKYADATTIPWLGRIVITCNVDAGSLDALPQLDGTVLDKLILMKMADRVIEFPPKSILEATIREEIPHYLDALANWEPPPEVVGDNRFGVIPYHHPELVAEAREKSPEQNLADVIDEWVVQYRTVHPEATEWEGKPVHLLMELMATDSLKDVCRHYKLPQVGSLLKKLRLTEWPRIKDYRNGGSANVYKLDLT